MESPNVIKIQNMINALAIDRNIISVRIFLFSVLFMLEKNIDKHIRDANNNPTKWKLKFWGLIIFNKLDAELGIKDQFSRENAI